MSTTSERFKALFGKARQQFEYFLEGAKLGFTEDVVKRMSDLRLTKAGLANKLQCDPSYITKVLRGSTNFTLESMVKIGIALDSELDIKLRPKNVDEDWSQVLHMGNPSNRTTSLLLNQFPNTRSRSFASFTLPAKNEQYINAVRIPASTSEFVF